MENSSWSLLKEMSLEEKVDSFFRSLVIIMWKKGKIYYRAGQRLESFR